MTDDTLESVGRLRAWVRDFGHLKEPVFIADLNRVLDAIHPKSAEWYGRDCGSYEVTIQEIDNFGGGAGGAGHCEGLPDGKGGYYVGSPPADQPRFEHDCERDVFLGRYEWYDLYFADHGGISTGFIPDRATVIARSGSDGPDYISGIGFVGQFEPLTEAMRRATERGLIRRVDQRFSVGNFTGRPDGGAG
jgi:hypothetical protein